jgi:hypothetical protein
MTRVLLRRVPAIGALVAGLVVTTACGSGKQVATVSSRPVRRTTGLVLAQFVKGVGAVSPGSIAPVWHDPAAVSAADGSAVFSVRSNGSDRLVRVDRRTGAGVSSWRLSGGLSITAVAPDGRWVALTNRPAGYGSTSGGGSTEIVVFDPQAGSEVHRMVLAGNLRPEAFSVDGKLIFALDYRGDHYRVQTIDLSNGQRFDTSNRDKTVEPEDMHGASVRGVMSTDRTLLATLYRDPGNADEPAFVHVLDLVHGWSYCADLPRPFGTGPPGSDVIELTPAHTVVVADMKVSRVAEIHVDEVHTPGNTPVDVEYRDGTVALDGSAFRSTPGFSHVIAALPTSTTS